MFIAFWKVGSYKLERVVFTQALTPNVVALEYLQWHIIQRIFPRGDMISCPILPDC